MSHRADDPLSGRLYRSAEYPEVRMTDPTTDVPVERPNPLRSVAASVGTAWAGVSGLLGAATAFGLLTAAQADALNTLGSALPGWIMALGVIAGAVFPVVGTLIGSFHTAKVGERKVTPLSSPRDVDGRRLVPAGDGPVGVRVNELGGDR